MGFKDAITGCSGSGFVRFFGRGGTAEYNRTAEGYPCKLSGYRTAPGGAFTVYGSADGVGNADGAGGYTLPLTFSGINLLPTAHTKSLAAEDRKGLAINRLPDGTFHIHGTSTGAATFNFFSPPTQQRTPFKAGTYHIVANPAYQTGFNFRDENNTLFQKPVYGGTGTKLVLEKDFVLGNIYIYLNKAGTYDFIYSPQIAYEAVPYEPYQTPQTFTIYLGAPLYGTDGVYDTAELDVKRKKATVTRRVSVSSTGVIAALSNPVTTDISGTVDWDAFPQLWEGTVIVGAETQTPPSKIAAEYYSLKTT